MIHRRPRLRRSLIALAAIGLVAGVANHFLPELVAWRLSRALAASGFPDARFEVTEVGWSHVRLAHVELAPGLALGEVELAGGLTMLWRDPDRLTVRGARVVHAALAGHGGGGGGSGSPVHTIRIEDSVLVVGGLELAVAGTIALDAEPAGDLVATLASWRSGDFELRDIAIRLRDHRACATARLATTELEACATVASWQPEDLAVAWTARDPRGHAAGRARLTWANGVVVRDGHFDVAIPHWESADLVVDGAVIAADFAATALAFEAHGELRATRAGDRAATVVLVDVAAPVAVHGDGAGWQVVATELRARAADGRFAGTRLHAANLVLATAEVLRLPALPAELSWRADELHCDDAHLAAASGTFAHGLVRWRAAAGRWGELRATRPAGTLAGSRLAWAAPTVAWRDVRVADASGTLDTRTSAARWRAREATRGGVTVRDPQGSFANAVHHLAWTGVRTPDVALGGGELALRTGDRPIVERGSVRAYGGTLALAHPAALAGPLAIQIRGVQLADALAAVDPGLAARVTGRGTLDGELAIAGGRLVRASLRARGQGTLRMTDARWLDAAVAATRAGPAIPQRIAGALADFEYAQLGIELAPRANPELRVAIRGRGKRIPQELDLVVNVRRVRG